MLQSSLRLGTVAGIRIGVHYTWFIIFFLISFSLYTFFRQQHDDWSANLALATAVITSLLFFASIILHELGHSIVAIARGIRVASITLFIFGGVAQTEKDSDSAATEFWVAIAGPLVSFFLAGMFYVLGILFGSYSEAVAESLAWLASINLMVAIFNLIPGFPLDGGRVFRAVIWGLSGNATKGMNWAVISGRVAAIMGTSRSITWRASTRSKTRSSRNFWPLASAAASRNQPMAASHTPFNNMPVCSTTTRPKAMSA